MMAAILPLELAPRQRRQKTLSMNRRLGYPEAALADADYALADARDLGQTGTLGIVDHSELLAAIAERSASVGEP